MRPMDLLTAPLSGVNLIEASAGTGKTYTLSQLYLRLVLELAIPVERILVVTFTKAATAELKQRLRARLSEFLQALERGHTEELFIQTILARCENPETAKRLLVRAILGFDRAAIFTIHGFCQRVLGESAFESGRPFEVELIGDESELLQEVVDDFWRREVQDLSAGFLSYLQVLGISPNTLASRIGSWVGKAFLQINSSAPLPDVEGVEQRFEQSYQQVRDTWLQDRGAVEKLLLESGSLNRNRYRKPSVENWCRSMDAYLGETRGEWFDAFSKFTSSEIAQSLKKDAEEPKHRFFSLCEDHVRNHQALQSAYEGWFSTLLADLLDFSREEMRLRKQRAGVQSYDDLLGEFSAALEGEKGERLASLVRARYSVALVDEFQDTDPVQYRIFSTLYACGEMPFYMVGDPKQAIYSFRGADIFAYLRASQETDEDNRFTLDTNWRSVPGLVESVNLLFDQPQGGFYYPQIGFRPARSAFEDGKKSDELTACGKPLAPMGFGLLPAGISKTEAGDLAADWTASEIVRLLRGGSRGEVLVGDEPLGSEHIAVLVPTHRRGEEISAALKARGINSVVRSRANVFDAAIASDLMTVLQAIAEPGRESRIRAALVSNLFGLDGIAIDQLSDDSVNLERYLRSFHQYHERWREHGFIHMFRLMLREQDIPARLRKLQAGERQLTDLLHLAELLHREERSSDSSIEGLLKWLSHRIHADFIEEDEHQLRLESDEKLVQIVTIHRSKGLQYPVVFCPYSWDESLRAGHSPPVSYHDPDADNAAFLDLGSEQFHRSSKLATEEELAERLRLLYVALTRAEKRCYVLWGNVKGSAESAMSWLLFPPAEVQDGAISAAMKKRLDGLGEEEVVARVEELVQESAGAIFIERVGRESVGEAAGRVLIPEGASGSSLDCREMGRALQADRRISSFSSLISHEINVDLPDHDAGLEMGAAEQPAQSEDIFTFPRGARAGSCLHAVFESIDFATVTRQEIEQVAAEKLSAFGIDAKWTDTVADMVRDVLDQKLDSGMRLRDIPDGKRFIELEFYFPAKALSAEKLSGLLLKHELGQQPGMAAALERLRFRQVDGYIKGFIDLVFESGGRFHLLDYKSNWLGGSHTDYAENQMGAAMIREGYYLQYLLYAVALHRYLAGRIPGYDYESHFGSIHYLFLRGVNPASDQATGVFQTRPSRKLIEDLDRLLGAGERMLNG